MMLAAAAVATAGVTLFVVVLAVVIALHIGVERKISGDKRFDCRIRAAGHAAVELDAGLCQNGHGVFVETALGLYSYSQFHVIGKRVKI